MLDVGCGTGQWAYEMCEEFPRATVIGIDLVSSKPGPPPGYRFVKGNVLQGVPFAAGSFDFVHQRLLISGIPVRSWPQLVDDLARVTRPGGWVELDEGAPGMEPEGPATQRLFEHLRRLGREVGLDTTGIVPRSLDKHLRRAGLVDVQTWTGTFPVGEWGGEVGSLLATDLRAVFMRLSGVFQARFGVPEAESLDLIRMMQRETEEQRSSIGSVVAYGRKPP
jgi:SAM-dependent methyltransferase